MNHFVSATCRGEVCGICIRAGVRTDASHKLAEEIPHDDPNRIRHELTMYVCCRHFTMVVGPSSQCGATDKDDHTIDVQLWKAAQLKAKQLEREIRESAASAGEKSDMLHSLSKLCMFIGDSCKRSL